MTQPRVNHRWVAIPPEERFWDKVNKTDSCWLWISALDKAGYGYLKVGSNKNGYRIILAHRLSWKIKYGDVPSNLDVLHSCDIRNCVNPDHLWLGTHKENMADMVKKGRTIRAVGSKTGAAKLKEADILDIRKLYSMGNVTHKVISEKYNVCESAIGHILSRRNWKHI